MRLCIHFGASVYSVILGSFAHGRSASRSNAIQRQRPGRRGQISAAVIIEGNVLEIPQLRDVVASPTVVNSDYEFQPRPKKRQFNRVGWKSRQLKLVRRDYKPCKCEILKRCYEKFPNDTFVETIRNEYFGFREYADQQKFIWSLIEKRAATDRCLDNAARQRAPQFRYRLPDPNEAREMIVKLNS